VPSLHFAALALVACALLLRSGAAADPFFGADPAWTLLHEPAVERELRLAPAQSRQFRGLLDELDARFFPLRNMLLEESAAPAAAILAEGMERLRPLLSEPQRRRLAEVRARRLGTGALVGDELAKAMRYEPRQRERIDAIIADTNAATRELERRAGKGEPREPLEREFDTLKRDELRTIGEVLTPRQRAHWQKAVGRDFDLSSLGRARFKAPELVDSGAWLNSGPLTLAGLSGKVVVLHFYAFGCINCVRNFPTYCEWQDRFRDRNVVILGIHTPETTAERDAARVAAKADEAGFRFPVLIDGDKANWNAWGNSMWPSVYLIDARGSLRHFWPGELKWQGATGDVWIRERIEELLAEAADTP